MRHSRLSLTRRAPLPSTWGSRRTSAKTGNPQQVVIGAQPGPAETATDEWYLYTSSEIDPVDPHFLNLTTGIGSVVPVSHAAAVLPPDGLLESNYKYGTEDMPHGFFRKLNQFGDIEFCACFVNGHLHGPVWKSLVGGKSTENKNIKHFSSYKTCFLFIRLLAFLFFKKHVSFSLGSFLLSSSMEFTSKDTIFLYPDCRTALVGHFQEGQMVKACLGEVVGVRPHCTLNCTVMWPRIGNIVKVLPKKLCVL